MRQYSLHMVFPTNLHITVRARVRINSRKFVEAYKSAEKWYVIYGDSDLI